MKRRRPEPHLAMRLIPREEKFFRFFRRQAELNVEAAALLCDASRQDPEHVQAVADRIRDLEHEGDTVLREVFALLRKTFITPLDAEDIHRLAERQDDLLDDIEETAFRLAAYRLEATPAAAAQAAEIVRDACGQLVAAVEALEKDRPVHQFTEEVTRLEERADKVLRAAELALFAAESDPITLLKHKELIEWMEAIADRCEDVADVLENIVVKNA